MRIKKKSILNYKNKTKNTNPEIIESWVIKPLNYNKLCSVHLLIFLSGSYETICNSTIYNGNRQIKGKWYPAKVLMVANS